MVKYKYTCKQCKFNTNYESQWLKHTNTTKHKTGKRKTRSDKIGPIKCTLCKHVSLNNANMKIHVLNNHSSKEERKKGFKYYCKYCDYGSFAKTSYNTHINTKKHKHIVGILG